MAAKANLWMIEQIGKNLKPGEAETVEANDKESACLLGMRRLHYQFQPLEDLKECLLYFYKLLVFYKF